MILSTFLTVTTKIVRQCTPCGVLTPLKKCPTCQHSTMVKKHPNHVEVLDCEVQHPLHVLTSKVLKHLERNQWLIYSNVTGFSDGDVIILSPDQIELNIGNFKKDYNHIINKLQKSPLVKSVELEFGIINVQS